MAYYIVRVTRQHIYRADPREKEREIPGGRRDRETLRKITGENFLYVALLQGRLNSGICSFA